MKKILIQHKRIKNIGKAGSNPQTAGPSENLREEAAEKTNEGDQSEEPA